MLCSEIFQLQSNHGLDQHRIIWAAHKWALSKIKSFGLQLRVVTEAFIDVGAPSFSLADIAAAFKQLHLTPKKPVGRDLDELMDAGGYGETWGDAWRDL